MTAFGGKGGFTAEFAFDGNVPSVVFVARGDTGHPVGAWCIRDNTDLVPVTCVPTVFLAPDLLQDLIYGAAHRALWAKDVLFSLAASNQERDLHHGFRESTLAF